MMPTFSRLAAAAVTSLGLACPAWAAPAIWEIRDDDSAIWVFGSFHVLPSGTTWRTELFNQILADADQVTFEADVRPSAVAEVSAEAFVRGIYTDGTLLTAALSPELEAELRDKAAAISLPMGSILAMRPWMATNTITLQALLAEGYDAQGVEFVLQPELADERLDFLESGAQQLDVLSGAPEDEQVAMLTATLEQLDTLPKLMDKMLDSWLAGTPEELGDLFLMEMGGFEEVFLERLIYARNRNWIAPLEAMLAQDRENLVIVGAAHLIGDGSVLDLLEKAGYGVERIQ
ncbi:TraB/GumN family protein [Devosia oryziradicis]|uniref:TraB/GumN family protein n=1 Tax=Devosia oryziradicis TaxID=2801335 RepID=A0ABX7BTL7_9HYPH|nr:TraB/GumN family protein [Devosia oryziradicis]QQR35281.1 TraB/GumN family protein [Devosia oryziradicis]